MIVSICNEKGGSGKSTLAINIAIEQGRVSGELPLLIDTDPQKSVASFLNIRNEVDDDTSKPRASAKLFIYTHKVGEYLKGFLAEMREKQPNKNIIIDTAGWASREMYIAIGLSDMIVIPAVPAQLDVSVLDKMVDRVKMAKEKNPNLKALIVISRASPNPFLQKKIESLKAFVEYINAEPSESEQESYIKLANTIIYEREIYKIATQMGLGVVEMQDSKNKAKAEIAGLCKEIF